LQGELDLSGQAIIGAAMDIGEKGLFGAGRERRIVPDRQLDRCRWSRLRSLAPFAVCKT